MDERTNAADTQLENNVFAVTVGWYGKVIINKDTETAKCGDISLIYGYDWYLLALQPN